MIDVHWLEQTEVDVPSDDDWLGAEETSRLHSMRFPKRRAEWRLGRWTAKLAACSYLELPPDRISLAAIQVRPAPTGAPMLFVSGRPADASISLSHRDGTSLCAIAPARVTLGCDLERIEIRSDSFAADFFTRDEYAVVCAAPARERALLVTLIWSAKEAGLKALQEGLRRDTRSVAVVPPDALHTCAVGEWHPLLVESSAADVFHGWWQCANGFVKTMVACPAPFPPVQLHCVDDGVRSIA